MTTTHRERLVPRPAGVVRALARAEALRMLRSPLPYVGVVLSLAFGVTVVRSTSLDGDWSGAEYGAGAVLFVPLLIPVAVVVAWAFHREREPVGLDTPTSADARAAASLFGALPLVVLVSLLTIGLAGYAAATGGFELGEEPGKTQHAMFSAFELLQHPALAVLAVTTGAAAGRRFAHRSTAALVLFAGWFPPMFVYWLFQAPAVVPFSIVQVQPVNVEVAPVDTDPLTLPADWLLSAPGEFQDFWGRQFVSSALAGWHDLWLLGLACLFLGLVFSGPWRRRLLVTGMLACCLGIGAQYWVIP